MAKNKTAIEHYVSQAYLKYFANDKQQCYVYDKQNDKHFVSNIKGVLAERYLYDFNRELMENCSGIEEQAVEQILGKTVDKYWCNIVDNITKNSKGFSLKNPGYFFDIYRCAIIQLIRTPNGKKTLLHMYNEVYGKENDKRFENIVLAKEICNVLDENMRSDLLRTIFNEYGHIAIGINKTDIPFVTSDTPVFVLPNIWDKSKTESMMYYPITPQRCIFFLKIKQVDVNQGKFVIKELADIPQEIHRKKKEMLNQVNPPKIVLREDDILVLNSYCGEAAIRYIISNKNIEQEKLWKK